METGICVFFDWENEIWFTETGSDDDKTRKWENPNTIIKTVAVGLFTAEWNNFTNSYRAILNLTDLWLNEVSHVPFVRQN
jgi:hypothetical protein